MVEGFGLIHYDQGRKDENEMTAGATPGNEPRLQKGEYSSGSIVLPSQELDVSGAAPTGGEGEEGEDPATKNMGSSAALIVGTLAAVGIVYFIARG